MTTHFTLNSTYLFMYKRIYAFKAVFLDSCSMYQYFLVTSVYFVAGFQWSCSWSHGASPSMCCHHRHPTVSETSVLEAVRSMLLCFPWGITQPLWAQPGVSTRVLLNMENCFDEKENRKKKLPSVHAKRFYASLPINHFRWHLVF